MKTGPESSRPRKSLRARAEALLVKKGWDIERMPARDVRKLVGELEVHQVELEMQNDELRRAREALEEAAKRFSDLYDFAPCALLGLSQHGKIEAANLAAANLLGLERAKLLQQTFNRFIPAEAQDAFSRYCRQVLDSETKQTCELTLKSAAGNLLTVLVEGIVAEDLATGQTQCRLSLSDLTGHKRAEQALHEMDEKYRLLVENAREAIYVVQNGVIRFANPATLRLTGLPEAEVMGSTCLSYIPPEDRAAALAYYDKLMRGEIAEGQREFRLLRPDGAPVWLSVNAVRILWNGQPATLNFASDITKRHQAEEAQHRLASAVEQAAETIMITDVQGTILYVNPAFEQITGYSRQEAVGQNPRLLKSGKHDAAFYAKMWAALTKGEVWRGRMTDKRKDGTLFEEDSSIAPIRDAAGQIVNYVGVKRDVTHEVELEDQLRQSQKLQAVGQLAGGVAHDFNNVLAVIYGNAELLLMKDEHLSPGAAECAKQVIAAAQHAASLTRQLLIFSRKQEMQSQPVALNDLIKNLSKMLKRMVREDICLEGHYAAQLPFIQADPGMIEQVVLNLVVNARDAMPKGGQLLLATEAVSVDEAQAQRHRGARAGEYVCLTVSDTGTGIAAENLPRIFEPFFTTKDVGKGTGLGLATVYGIVEQHQGWIEVSTQPGEGAIFKIFLPAIAAPAEKAAAAPAGAELRGGAETILLVEDDEPVRMITRRVLERYGYKILEAGNVREAREVWRNHAQDISLLLTDIIMPEKVTGRDLAEELRQERPGLRVVFMSGYSAEAMGQDTEFLRRVAGGFLHKPCSPADLIQTVRQCLDAPPPGG